MGAPQRKINDWEKVWKVQKLTYKEINTVKDDERKKSKYISKGSENNDRESIHGSVLN